MTEPSADVVIIGAGMAGLTAAIELKRLGLSYLILEAQSHAGGRGASIRTASGVAVDLGAHWLHGEDNPLKEILNKYNLPYDEDKADEGRIYQNGKVEKANVNTWIGRAIDKKKAKRIKNSELPDTALPELAADPKSHILLSSFASMWDGLDPPLQPSALEFLTDENTPGGLQLPQGLGTLFDHMVQEAGRECICFDTPVSLIASTPEGAQAQAENGHRWQAKRVLFTGSPGVIKSGAVIFRPPLSPEFQTHMAGVAMGKMNKIILELSPDFFEKRNIPKNLSLELLDGPIPHFCHVRSCGNPLISLFVAGPKALEVEWMTDHEAVAYMQAVLAPVKELAAFETYLTGKPIITRWVGNPFIRGSYSACLPGARRSWPRQEGNIYFCGDTFDVKFPASLAGASRSGQAAARLAAEDLRP